MVNAPAAAAANAAELAPVTRPAVAFAEAANRVAAEVKISFVITAELAANSGFLATA